MAGRVQIIDGRGGSSSHAKVDQEGNLFVNVDPNPRVVRQHVIPFRQYFKNSAGSSSMLVDGSSTPVDFCVESHDSRDRFISMISFALVDASAILSKFGNITALTNGVRFWYSRDNIGEVDIHDSLKTNWDFIRMCAGNPAFGAANDAFRGSNIVGSSEAYIPMLDMKMFMPPYGLKIDAASTQRICLTIRDDVSSMDGLDAIAYGFEVIPRDSDEYTPEV